MVRGAGSFTLSEPRPKPTHIINLKKLQNLVKEAEISNLSELRPLAYLTDQRRKIPNSGEKGKILLPLGTETQAYPHSQPKKLQILVYMAESSSISERKP